MKTTWRFWFFMACIAASGTLLVAAMGLRDPASWAVLALLALMTRAGIRIQRIQSPEA